jgi:hypothetical protein
MNNMDNQEHGLRCSGNKFAQHEGLGQSEA